MIEHPLSKAVLATGVLIVDEELYGERMRYKTTAHEGSIGGIGEHGLHLFLCSLVGQFVFLRHVAKAVAQGFLVHHFLRLQDRGIAREQPLDRRIGISECCDDALLFCRLLLPRTFVVVNALDATIQLLTLRQATRDGTRRDKEAKHQAGYATQRPIGE